MKIIFNIFLFLVCAFLLLSCNKNLTDEEKKLAQSVSNSIDDRLRALKKEIAIKKEIFVI